METEGISRALGGRVVVTSRRDERPRCCRTGRHGVGEMGGDQITPSYSDTEAVHCSKGVVSKANNAPIVFVLASRNYVTSS